jgi:hypothetical protein
VTNEAVMRVYVLGVLTAIVVCHFSGLAVAHENKIVHKYPVRELKQEPDKHSVFHQDKTYALIDSRNDPPLYRLQSLDTVNGNLSIGEIGYHLRWNNKNIAENRYAYAITQDYKTQDGKPSIIIVDFDPREKNSCDATKEFYPFSVVDMEASPPFVSQDYMQIMLSFISNDSDAYDVTGLTIKKLDANRYSFFGKSYEDGDAFGHPLYVTYIYDRTTRSLTKQ